MAMICETEIGRHVADADDWKIVQIGDLGQILTGSTPPTRDASNYGSLALFVSPADIGANKYVARSEKKLSTKGFALSRNVPKGAILFVCIGSTIGKVGIASERLAFNQQINAIIPHGDVSGEYLYYALCSVASDVKAQAGTQAVPIVNKTQFSKTAIRLPRSRVEQEAIAHALSDADAYIESLDLLLAKKRAVMQGAMHELLTGKRRLPGFGGDWSRVRVGDVGYTYGGLSGKTKADFDAGDGRFITFLNIMNNVRIDCTILAPVRIGQHERQNIVAKGDLFFNGSSETPNEVGMCSVLLEDVPRTYLNSFCFGFRLVNKSVMNALFLAYYFRSAAGRQHFKSLAQGAIRYNLSKSAMMDLTIRVPCFKEQEAIAAILSDMDADISEIEAKQAKALDIKQGMMQDLLTGKVRLV